MKTRWTKRGSATIGIVGARGAAWSGEALACLNFSYGTHDEHAIVIERIRTISTTPSERIYRRLALWWGVWPYPVEIQRSTEALISIVEQRLCEDQLIEPGEHVVIMGGLPIAGQAQTNFVKLHRVGMANRF